MNLKAIPFLLFLSFSFCFQHLYGQSWKWAVGSVSLHRGIMEAWPITVDSGGNVYELALAGTLIRGRVDTSIFGTDTLTGEGWILVSTDSGGHYRWSFFIRGASWVSKVVTGPTGDIYLFGNGGTIAIGTDTLITSGAAFCARLDTTGHVKWIKKVAENIRSGAPSYGDVDGMGNIYVAGDFSSRSITIGTTTLYNSGVNSSDIFLAKLDSGCNPVWAKRFGGDSTEYVNSVAVTPGGNMVIGGTYISRSFSIGTASFANPTRGALNYFYVAEYDNLGNPVWANNIVNHSTWSTLNCVATDYWGNAYIVGSYRDHLTFGGFTCPYTIAFNAYMTQYSPTGIPMWTRIIDGSPGGYAVATDLCANVWMSGWTGVNIDDGFIAEYDVFGTFKDSVHMTAAGDDQSNIALDNHGNLYLGGDYLSTTVFGPDTLTLIDSTQETLLVAKYSYPFCADVKNPPLLHTTTAGSAAEVILYPNPATDEVTINAGTLKLTSATLYDITGRIVSSYQLHGNNTATVIIRNVHPGMYFCRIITSDNAVITRKLTVLQ